MTSSNFIKLLSGLTFFFFGMQMMKEELEHLAGNKMQILLEKFTSTKCLGIITATLVTAFVQSSSLITVMTVSLVGSKIMTLKQATWIIMGANIGTTFTSQMLAFDLGYIAPVIAFLGMILITFFKKKKFHVFGNLLSGIGVLYIGMETMSQAMLPLKNNPFFVEMLTNFTNPFIGVVIGTIFTAIIQSSSASVGILQALAGSGLINLSSSVYILFGQNIGTCITSVLASIGANRSAKEAMLVHLLFNVISMVVFIPLFLWTPLESLFIAFTPEHIETQIANIHTFLNIGTTIILFPFDKWLSQFAKKVAEYIK
ncbi:Na/Pi cotransporter family protein [Velocimicrobium porci]|nr:Na/Pi symporter [Velocimicrobium porci]